jgi:hypothetical protein
MRQLVDGEVLAVRAIGGLHVVTIAWDFVEGQDAKKKGLLGFAIERSEIEQDQVIERYFLRGIKRFKWGLHQNSWVNAGNSFRALSGLHATRRTPPLS